MILHFLLVVIASDFKSRMLTFYKMTEILLEFVVYSYFWKPYCLIITTTTTTTTNIIIISVVSSSNFDNSQ